MYACSPSPPPLSIDVRAAAGIADVQLRTCVDGACDGGAGARLAGDDGASLPDVIFVVGDIAPGAGHIVTLEIFAGSRFVAAATATNVELHLGGHHGPCTPAVIPERMTYVQGSPVLLQGSPG